MAKSQTLEELLLREFDEEDAEFAASDEGAEQGDEDSSQSASR